MPDLRPFITALCNLATSALLRLMAWRVGFFVAGFRTTFFLAGAAFRVVLFAVPTFPADFFFAFLAMLFRISHGPELFGRELAGLAIAHHFERHGLVFLQTPEARTLDGTDVYKDVASAVIGCNEAIALRRIEPLHFTSRHVVFSLPSVC
jgi:hypothetical protein